MRRVHAERTCRPTATSGDWFSDVAEASGLHFTHVNGMSGKFYYPEIIGSGVALFDCDNDGDLDVFLVQDQGRSRLFRERPCKDGRAARSRT